MKTDYIAVNGVEDGIDFDAHYRLYLKVGIAWVLLGWEKKFEPITFLANDDEGNEYEEESGEFDEVADHEHIVAVMVGDDRREVFDVEDVKAARIPENAFCRDCGQIGCFCNVYV
jgi:hypothetical protein